MRHVLIIFALAFGLSGCVQQPTAMTEIADTSPTVNFAVAGDADALELIVDGISYGALSQYLAPEKALKLVPGKHLVEVVGAWGTVFSQDVYLSESTHRTIETNL